MNINNDIKKLHFFNKFEEKITHEEVLHPKITKQIASSFQTDIRKLCHVIFYGPPGSGKYTLALKLIKKYSPSKLKYEKKITLSTSKSTVYSIKISDIHYEIDMSTLGCNCRNLWHEMFIHLVDTISLRKTKTVIFLCKKFHDINIELLDVFYSYLHDMNNKLCFGVEIKYILLTEHVSFIPDNIVNCCLKINVPRPTIKRYMKCFGGPAAAAADIIKVQPITNIANIVDTKAAFRLIPHQFICQNIVTLLTTKQPIKLLKFRQHLYELLTYNLNIQDCCWFILDELKSDISISKRFETIVNLYNFFFFYNNNYRPIYHLELLFLKLHKMICQQSHLASSSSCSTTSLTASSSTSSSLTSPSWPSFS